MHSGSRRFGKARTRVKLSHRPGSPLSDAKMEQKKLVAMGQKITKKNTIYIHMEQCHVTLKVKNSPNEPSLFAQQ